MAAAEMSVADAYIGLELEDLSTHGAVQVPMADAELALARHNYAYVICIMDDLIARLRKVGMRSFLSDALYIKGRALLSQNQIEAACQVLGAARANAESLGSRRILWQILASLGALEAGRGRHAEAQRLRAQARELIGYMAAHMPTQELSAAFLQQPLVRAITDVP